MIVLKSTYAGSFDFNPAPLVVDEITLLGSRCGPFAPALRLLAAGRVAVDDLIAAVYPFAEAVEAFAAARCPGTLKVLLAMS
jgi:threonine dehydrogenase-like Zn-dependent dehydrogenase